MKILSRAWVAMALRVVPREWRATVARDLADEAERAGKSTWWVGAEAMMAGAQLRPTVSGDVMWTDIKYAIRSLIRARWFSVGAILTFALGIGVNVAVFSAVDRMLFRPLPYDRPDDLYVLGEYAAGASRPYGTLPMSYVASARSLPGIIGVSQSGWDLLPHTSSEEPGDEQAVMLSEASYNALAVLGVRPYAGRDLTEGDARSRTPKALISYEVWQGRFAGRTDLVGSRLWRDRQQVEVVGILPPQFINASNFLDPRSDGLVLDPTEITAADARARAVPAIVRVKPGVSQTVVQSQIDAMVSGLRASAPQPATRIPTEFRIVPLRAVLFGGYVNYLWLVTVTAALVFLVAAANLSTLMSLRSRSRAQEQAVRAALGASRRRLVASAFTESLVLALAGAVVSLIVLELMNSIIHQTLPLVFSRFSANLAEPRVLLTTFACAMFAAAVAALAPALRSRRFALGSALHEGARGSSRRAGGRSMIVAETAISVLLVAGAAATVRNLVVLERRDLGFQSEGLFNVRVGLPPLPTPSPAAAFMNYSRVGEAIAASPRVREAAGVNTSPIWGSRSEAMTPALGTSGLRYRVGVGFLETIGVRLVSGRLMTAAEITTRTHVAVLSERGVKVAFPGAMPTDVIGRSLVSDGEAPFEIVGVVSDLRPSHAREPDPLLYVPLDETKFRFMEFAVRTTDSRPPSIVEIRRSVKQAGLEPTSVGVTDVAERLGEGLLNARFRAALFGSFAVVAMALAIVGLYSLASFEVAQRHRELGIRVALGATPLTLARGVIADTGRPVLLGVAGGVAGSYWMAAFLQEFLNVVDARDPGTLALVAALLTSAAVGAAWIPARRAARTDPALVLRSN